MTPTTEQPVNTTTQSSVRIKVHKGVKGQEAQLPPVTEVDKYLTHQCVPLANARCKAPLQATGTIQVPEGQGMLTMEELEDSDFDDILFSLPKPKSLVARFPQPTPRHYIMWLEQCCKTIEDRGEPLNKLFSDVSRVLLHTLEDAEKTRGGPKGILAKVSKLAQNAYVWQVSAVFRDCDKDQETGAE